MKFSRVSSILLALVILIPGPTRAEQINSDLRAQISAEMHAIDNASGRLKRLSEKKSMSGRGWTALDDLVVGAATLAAAGLTYGMLTGLPRVFPKARLLKPSYLRIPKTGTIGLAVVGAYSLLQGALVYPFVPKAELATGDEDAAARVEIQSIDLGSLSEPEARELLARLRATRRELEVSSQALTDRLTPKLESRLAFIASNVISGSMAVIAIGGGIYFLGSAPRMAPRLVRSNFVRALLMEQPQLFRKMLEAGFGVSVQGGVGVLTGVLIKIFVPKNTKEAAPVN